MLICTGYQNLAESLVSSGLTSLPVHCWKVACNFKNIVMLQLFVMFTELFGITDKNALVVT